MADIGPGRVMTERPAASPKRAAYVPRTWRGACLRCDQRRAEAAASLRGSRTLQLGADRKLTAEYDAAGRLTSIDDTGRGLLRRELSPDGHLLRAITEKTATSLEYDHDGLASRVIVSPPEEKGQFQHWQATKLDPTGSPREITDYRGLQVFVDYTNTGLLRSVITKRDGKNLGFEISRDDRGLMREIKSSWGAQRYSYDINGQLAKLDVEQAGQTSTAEWRSGALQKIRRADGGEYHLAYYEDEKRRSLPKAITTPNGLTLAYEYDDAKRLSQVDVGALYSLSLRYDKSGDITEWIYAPRSGR